MRRAPNLDRNHREVVEEFERLGYAVQNLPGIARGVPDLIVSDHMEMWWVEVKDGPKASHTSDQVKWERTWKSKGGKPPITVRSVAGVRKFHEQASKGAFWSSFDFN